MRARSLSLAALAAFAVTTLVPARASGQLPRVRVSTSLGDIVIAVDTVHAPVTSANFLSYVDAGMYANGRFHRTVTPQNQPDNLVKIEVIQGGRDSAHAGERAPIPLERTSVTKLKHLDGTVSMARGGPDTATSDFFICIGDQPELNYGGKRNPDGQGFAAFGRVVRGMDVVRKIHGAPAKGQALVPVIPIVGASRVSR